ncbi:TolB family protein [Pedobacter sp. AW31-3R]|uniref:TolB family protein n=1 Tax=Pedobacter sp. AW31-3R TaxID=3445781 RepID=UPI003F9EFF17
MGYLKKNIRLLIGITSILHLSAVWNTANAQVYNREQNPLSVSWREINTSGFKVIYPTEMEKEAQRMANTLRYIFPYVGNSLNVKKTTIPVLLQNRGVLANGFVQLAPKKSEFYTTPPQSFDSQDWLNNLAVHELRHAAQFDKLTNGRAYPFPEEAYYALMGAGIPLWFFEGDAVSTETSLTHAGRGRQPVWIMPYRTSILEGKEFSYSKANFGSQKDITPGYYQLGYLLASQIRESSGKFVFDSVLTDLKKRPVRLYPFAKSLKKYTGKTGKEWYDFSTARIRKDWEAQAESTPSRNYPQLSPTASYETNYYFPVKLADGKILTLKQSKAEAAAFVLTSPDGKEKRLQGIGYQESPWFSYANGKIVWDEVRYDPRFFRRSYSVICSYDLETGKVKKLSSRSRLFSPSLSKDGTRIVAVSIDLSNQIQLVVLHAADGKMIRSYPNPQNLLIQTPSFSDDDHTIAYISVAEQGKALWTVTDNGNTSKIIPETAQQLRRPVFIKDQIAFNAHYNGIDNIYQVNVSSKKITALSAAKYGAFNPTPIEGTDSVLFNNYNLYGYGVSKTILQAEEVALNHFVYFGAAAEKQENTGNVFSAIPDSNFTSKPYHKLGHLFNFHSISPNVEDEYKAGLQLKSNNLLNTVDTYAGIDYQRDLRRFEYNAGISFKSFYPIFNLSYRNLPRRAFYETTTGFEQGDWRENYVALQAQIPVSLSAQNHNYNFSVNLGTSYTQRYAAENMPANYITRLQFPLQTGFTFTHSIRAAERDIAPRWAQTIRLTYLSQPFDPQLSGDLFAAEGFFYFPGIAKNHVLLANFNYQESSGIRAFTNAINTVYGYNNIRANSRLKNTLLLNYRFPIAFPDTEIGPLAYITNVRGALFCHYENLGSGTDLSAPKTYGFELHSSMNLMRYEPVFDLGTRFVFVNKQYHQNPIFELIVNYTF